MEPDVNMFLTENPGTVLLGGYSASQQNPTGSQDGIVKDCNGNNIRDDSGIPKCTCQTGYAGENCEFTRRDNCNDRGNPVATDAE